MVRSRRFRPSPAFAAVLFLTTLAGCTGPGEAEVPAALNPAPPIRKAWAEKILAFKEPIEAYRLENGKVPEGEGTQVLRDAGITNFPPEDSWGNAIRYKGAGQDYEISSAGPDRQWGTRDDVMIRNGRLEGTP